MSTVEDIERAIEHLPEPELAHLREWFDERDAKAGKLDEMAQRALADLAAGRTRKL